MFFGAFLRSLVRVQDDAKSNEQIFLEFFYVGRP